MVCKGVWYASISGCVAYHIIKSAANSACKTLIYVSLDLEHCLDIKFKNGALDSEPCLADHIQVVYCCSLNSSEDKGNLDLLAIPNSSLASEVHEVNFIFKLFLAEISDCRG